METPLQIPPQAELKKHHNVTKIFDYTAIAAAT